MFGIIINSNGYKVDLVVLNEDKSPQFYDLKDGETIIEEDWHIANSMNKPQWQFDTGEWIDTAPLPPVVTEPVEPNEMEVRLGQIEDAVGILATQVAQNTLLNGGVR